MGAGFVSLWQAVLKRLAFEKAGLHLTILFIWHILTYTQTKSKMYKNIGLDLISFLTSSPSYSRHASHFQILCCDLVFVCVVNLNVVQWERVQGSAEKNKRHQQKNQSQGSFSERKRQIESTTTTGETTKERSRNKRHGLCHRGQRV